MNIINVTDKLYPTHPLKPLKLDSIRFIVVHHLEASKVTWEDVNRWHKQDNGWACVGYNEMIMKNGDVFILRGDNIGAHTLNWNSLTYGIALEGNYDKETIVPEAQYLALLERCKTNLKRFSNQCTICGHNDLMATKCPGQNFPPYMTKLHKDVLRKDVNNLTIDEAIQIIIDEKIINNAEYRKMVCSVVLWEKEFVISVAKKILELKEKIK